MLDVLKCHLEVETSPYKAFQAKAKEKHGNMVYSGKWQVISNHYQAKGSPKLEFFQGYMEEILTWVCFLPLFPIFILGCNTV